MTPNRPTERAAIYARISSDRQEGAGVRRQEADGRKLAAELGWDVVDVYVDNDISAYSGKVRPSYRRLLADMAAGKINRVIAWAPDRLHRSPRELEDYVDLAERHGVITHTVQSGAWDLSTPSGRAVARTLGAWARYESEHKSERIKRAAVQRAEEGVWDRGNRKVYGWAVGGQELVPAEADLIRQATGKITAGVSLRAVTSWANDAGYAAPSGGRWSSTALREVLLRPRNAALSESRGEIVGVGQWPAIVTEDELSAVRAVLTDSSRRNNADTGGAVKWLGSGLYVCGVCGSANLRVTNARSYKAGKVYQKKSYRCFGERGGERTRGHVSRDAHRVDEVVREVIVQRLADPVLLAALTAAEGADTHLADLRSERLGLRARLDEAAQMFADGTISAAQLGTITKGLTSRLDELDDVLTAAASTSALGPFTGAEAADVAHIWDRLDLGSQRAVLDAVVTVTVHPATTRGKIFDTSSIEFTWKGGDDA